MSDNNTKRTDSFLKGTLILTVAGIVVKVIGSLNWIILSRVMGGEGIGLYQMAFPIYLLALSISSAGIPVAISILTAEKLALEDYRGANRVFRISLSVLAATGLLCSILLYFGAGWLIEHKFVRDARAYYAITALAPAIFFVTILSSYRGYFQGWQMMTPTAVSQIVEQLVRVLTMIVFASMLMPWGLEYGAAGASFGAAPGAAFGLVVLLYYYWKQSKAFKQKLAEQADTIVQEPSIAIIKRIIRLALPVSLSSLMLPVVSNLDLIIVPARLEVAGYTVEQATELFGYLTGMAVPLVNLSTILTASLATSLVPAVSEALSLGDRNKVYQRTASAMRISNLITIPGFVGMWLLATPVSEMIYHAPQAGGPISILSVSVFLLGIHQVTTGVLQGMGHTTIPVVNMGIAAVAKVILNWTLTAIPTLGILGSSWATVADIGVAALLNMYFVHRYVGFTIDVKDTFKTAIAAAAMGVAVVFVYDAVNFEFASNTLATLASVAIAAVVYALVLIAVGGAQEQDIMRIPMIGAKLACLLRRLGVIKK